VSKGMSLNPPTELSATVALGNVVSLKWVDNSNNEEGFKIERKGRKRQLDNDCYCG